MGTIRISLTYFEKISKLKKMVDLMEKRGHKLIVDRIERDLTEDELIERLPGINGYIIGDSWFTSKAIEYSRNLKVISRTGSGYDKVDIKAANEKGIIVCNTPKVGAIAVADFTLGLMIDIARRISFFDREIRKGRGWDFRKRVIGTGLYKKTLGIIGWGNIGKEVGKRAKCFSMNVICYDRKKGFPRMKNIAYVPMEDLLRRSDFISLHIPLNERTRGFFGRKCFELMKNTAYLINTSRGGIVDEDDLHWALTNHIIAGAASDVFIDEPVINDNPLLRLENFIATPHIAGLDERSVDKIFVTAVANCLQVLGGRRPRFMVNPEVFGKREGAEI